jgi:hypothetical protein
MKLRVVVVEPGREPQAREIGDDLDSLQAIVGGYIEVVPLGDLPGLLIVCNEEGIMHALPLNRGLHGTFFVVRSAGTEFGSLTVSDEKAALRLFQL